MKKVKTKKTYRSRKAVLVSSKARIRIRLFGKQWAALVSSKGKERMVLREGKGREGKNGSQGSK
ncbi:MAG: hypothetical protein RR202_12650 [Bacteroidales bacterium]